MKKIIGAILLMLIAFLVALIISRVFNGSLTVIREIVLIIISFLLALFVSRFLYISLVVSKAFFFKSELFDTSRWNHFVDAFFTPILILVMFLFGLLSAKHPLTLNNIFLGELTYNGLRVSYFFYFIIFFIIFSFLNSRLSTIKKIYNVIYTGSRSIPVQTDVEFNNQNGLFCKFYRYFWQLTNYAYRNIFYLFTLTLLILALLQE